MEQNKNSAEVNEEGPDWRSWKALMETSGSSEPALTPEYFLALRELYKGSTSRPMVCFVHEDGELVGLAVVIQGKTKVVFGFGERAFLTLSLPTISITGSHALFRNPQAAAKALGRLSAIPHHALIFERLDPTNPVLKAALQEPATMRRYRQYQPFGETVTCTATIAGTWEEYLKRLPGKVRHELHRKEKNLEKMTELTPVTLERIDKEEDILQYHEKIRKIGDDTWQRLRTGDRSVDSTGPGVIEYLRTLTRAGMLRGYILSFKGEPAAFAFGIRNGPCYHLKDIGFALRFNHHSPGQMLLYRLLQDLYKTDPPGSCDMGYGAARFKRELCDLFKPITVLWLPRRHSTTDLILRLHEIWLLIQGQIGNLLNRAGIKTRVISWLRHG